MSLYIPCYTCVYLIDHRLRFDREAEEIDTPPLMHDESSIHLLFNIDLGTTLSPEIFMNEHSPIAFAFLSTTLHFVLLDGENRRKCK